MTWSCAAVIDGIDGYVQSLSLRTVLARHCYRCLLREFARSVAPRRHAKPPSRALIETWLRKRATVWPLHMVLKRARLADRYLDWLVGNGQLAQNPLAALRHTYGQRDTTPIVRALLTPDSESALDALRPAPRFACHLGPAMRDHIERMRALGFRYDTYVSDFLRFDRFLQTQSDATAHSLSALASRWAQLAATPAGQLRRLTIGRVLAKALRRNDPTVPVPSVDRQLRREVQRQRRPPYIYSPDEVKRLLDTARSMPSPYAPLRPLTLYTMIVLAYCAGLRLGEVVRLALGDLDLGDETLDIRDTKFFKHRRLPLAPSVLAVLREYLEARRRAGAPAAPDSPLFWQEQGRRGYSFVTVEKLLTRVLRRAGLKPARGYSGPRIHDMRHAFAVRRLTDWYRAGLNAQARLPHLATYLGHKDLNSTLVYLTITQELLQEASKRFHVVGAAALACESRGVPCR